MEKLMQVRPSPSMAVALVALFIALTSVATGGPGKQLPANSVGTEQLKPEAVKKSDLGRRAVTGGAIKPGAVNTAALKPGAVNAAALKPGAVNAAAIRPGAVTSTAIAPAAVTEQALATGSVAAGKIKDQAITAGKIGPNAVTSTTIAPAAVGPPALASLAVTPGKIAPGAVNGTAIETGAVSSSKIEAGAVTGQKINDGAVTSSKLDDAAVTSPKIEAGAVITAKIGPKVVGTPQLSDAIPSSSASKTTNTTFNNGSYTALSYPTTLFDTANMHQVDYRMKAPVDGVYQVTAVATWANDGCGGTRSLEFNGREADGTTPFLTSPRISNTVVANVAATTTQSLTGMVRLNAGQGIEIWGGGSGMICGSSTLLGNPASSLTMSWVAPGPSS